MKYIRNIALHIVELALFAALLFLITWGYTHFREITALTYSVLFFLYTIIYPVIFGVLIRVPGLIKRWHKKNKFNWIRFLVVVLPGLVVITQIVISIIFETKIWFLFATDSIFLPLLGIWVGATLIDCIKGKENLNANDNIR